MADILEEIVAHKRVETDRAKALLPLCTLRKDVEREIGDGAALPSMSRALMESSTGIIAEFKRKSPSKGWIFEAASAQTVPLEYQWNGAAAISILTDEVYFGGDDAHIRTAKAAGVTIPILYKNFIIDEYQLLQARRCGASAVLLIAACLTKEKCRELMTTAHDLGMEVLLEMHDERDLEYAALQPDMYGINNRNLGSFVTDVRGSFRLAGQLPEGVCKVSESGISEPDTVRRLREEGYKGFLIGERFMRTGRPGEALSGFIRQLETR